MARSARLPPRLADLGVGPAILGEAASVAAAAGHPLPRSDRKNILRILTEPGSSMTSSLYRDLRAGRGTEVEQILGDLIRRAHAFGVATPLLDLATLALRVHQQRIHNSSPSGLQRDEPGCIPALILRHRLPSPLLSRRWNSAILTRYDDRSVMFRLQMKLMSRYYVG